MKETINFQLKKPDDFDAINVDDFNDNADIIDAELKEIKDMAEAGGDSEELQQQIAAVQQSAAMAQMLAQIGIDGAANAQQTADDALVATQTNAGNILASQNLLANHEMRITRIEDSLLNDISGNPFLITFDSLDGINLIKGVWNTEKERAEC